MGELVEIRWHGRGGQGVVTAGELLAEAALEEGKYFQAFPEYGAERMGAPIRAFTRISDAPIRQHCQITHPDVVVVLDPSLIGVVKLADGLKEGGALVVNTSASPQETRSKLNLERGRVYTVDATRIALDTMGRNITNTPMVGALLKAAGAVSKETLRHEIQKKLGSKFKAEVVEANLKAFERAYEETREG